MIKQKDVSTVMQRGFLPLAIITTLSGAAPLAAWAGHHHDSDENELPFAEAHIFFELNNTDGDLGIHALIDGEPWKQLKIEDQRERKILDIKVKGRLRKQGLTEIFFESAEPPFDELPAEKFFKRFPPGEYEIEGKTLDGIELESTTEITHVMPAPPQPSVNGSAMAQQCDEEEDGYDITVTSAPVTISWPAITSSHPDPEGGGAAIQPPVPVTINNYEVVVEAELEIDGEEFASIFSVILPPGVTQMTIPEEFIEQADTFKYEVLAREESYNQTAVESCFAID